MTPESIDAAVAELVATYGGGVQEVREGTRRLVCLDAVELYASCSPSTTRMLLVFDPSLQKPQVYVQPGQLLANGKVPRNSSIVLVGGESWMTFSFNIPWTEGAKINRFVAAARQRFAQAE